MWNGSDVGGLNALAIIAKDVAIDDREGLQFLESSWPSYLYSVIGPDFFVKRDIVPTVLDHIPQPLQTPLISFLAIPRFGLFDPPPQTKNIATSHLEENWRDQS